MARWLRPNAARAYLSLGQKSFERAVRDGQIVHARLPSGHRRFFTKDLDDFMRQFQVGNSASSKIKQAADTVMERV